MRATRAPWPLLAYLWAGPRDLPRLLRLEWRLTAVRWLGILFVGPGLMLMPLAEERRIAAYAILLFAAIYNLTVQRMMRLKVRLSTVGFVTTVADSVLNLAMLVSISAGFQSPFVYFLFSAIVSVAMRYGYAPALSMTAIYIATDSADSYMKNQPPDATYVFFCGFLVITALLACYLREEANRAEVALQERLRQADLLNDATATLGASLEFEPLLQAVTAAACGLFSSEYAVLQPESGLDDSGAALLAAYFPSGGQGPEHAALTEAFTHQHTVGDHTPGADWYQETTLATGQRAVILTLTVPNRGAPLARLALALPRGRQQHPVAPDVMESFVDRITLAIENASLYRTVARNNDDLARAYADLASAHQDLLSVDQMKTNFLANVSHELRTPLTSIRSFSELLLTYDDPGVRQEFLQIINAESERLTRLVNDVLDITKIESGYMEWQMATLDLADLLHDCARVFAPTLGGSAIVFVEEVSPALPPVYADHDRLQQVVGNLLSNARKFTLQGSITLRAVQVGAEVHVSVTDTGIGIPVDDQERIFEKFQQVGAMLTNKPQGTGLGLAISRDIVTHHGGRLWVTSAQGLGSTFAFALPLIAAEAQPRAERTVAAA